MSRITIATGGSATDTRLVASVRAITGKSVRAVAEALKSGYPISDSELFGQPRDEQFLEVRRLLDVLEAAGIAPLVREEGPPISAEILRNIMRSSEESMEELDKLLDLGHES